eukprot:1181586-Prorocentrum_minimum.AAC.6
MVPEILPLTLHWYSTLNLKTKKEILVAREAAFCCKSLCQICETLLAQFCRQVSADDACLDDGSLLRACGRHSDWADSEQRAILVSRVDS